MIKRYIEPEEYDKVIFDEGDYYPLIFNYAEDDEFLIMVKYD